MPGRASPLPSLPGLVADKDYVVGPASATADAIVVFDGATGKSVKNSGVTIDDLSNQAMVAAAVWGS